tara:strand:+ start:1035 stop:1586 length:552 start_codon:yes stop_codon:yes gene_type:complete
MLLKSNQVKIGFKAKKFKLININDKFLKFNDIKKEKGTIIAFICNHCPYVIDLIDRLVSDFNELNKLKFGTVAIMSNDVISYPQDSFENMKKFAFKNKFNFPYLYDEKQSVARSYKAVCTPDFFAFNKDDSLFYRGRLDNIRYKEKVINRKSDLINACSKYLNDNITIKEQENSMGCSIKWKK